MSSVIESDDYRKEEEVLKADPIVIAMADEIRNLAPSMRPDMTGHDFMGRANDEYTRQGGTNHRSIGGVARAIRALVG